MKKWTFGVIGVSVLLWAGSTDLAAFFGADSFFSIRRSVMLLTGVVLIALMGFAMVLALRLPVLERWIGGLDQMYHLHKWLGINAGLFLFLHYMTEQAPKWMVSAGWMARPARGARTPESTLAFPALKGLAGDIGEWILWIMPVLLLVALVRLIPWQGFRYTHKLFPVLFLGGAFHSVALMPSFWWTQPVGMWTVFWSILGSAAAIWSLSGRIGRNKRHQGTIAATHFHPETRILEVEIDLQGRPLSYTPGQFAFLRFERAADAHPFTIAGMTGSRVRFAIKMLGDLTRRLPDLAREGQSVQVEGPYGGFTFAGARPQVWVAGGIGITPFLARLEALTKAGGATQPITLHYCVRDLETALWPEDLAARCAAAGVDLQVQVAEQGQTLRAEHIARPAQGWPDIWFCGPSGFANALKTGLKRLGLPERQFHAERFQMR